MDAIKNRPRPRGKKPPSKQFLQKMSDTGYGIKVSSFEPNNTATITSTINSSIINNPPPDIPAKTPVTKSPLHQTTTTDTTVNSSSISSNNNQAVNKSNIDYSTSNPSKGRCLAQSQSNTVKSSTVMNNIKSQQKNMFAACKNEFLAKLGNSQTSSPSDFSSVKSKVATHEVESINSLIPPKIPTTTNTTYNKKLSYNDQKNNELHQFSNAPTNMPSRHKTAPPKTPECKPAKYLPNSQTELSVSEDTRDRLSVDSQKSPYNNLINRLSSSSLNYKPPNIDKKNSSLHGSNHSLKIKPNETKPTLTSKGIQQNIMMKQQQTEKPIVPPKTPRSSQTTLYDDTSDVFISSQQAALSNNSSMITNWNNFANNRHEIESEQPENVLDDDQDSFIENHKRNRMSRLIQYSEKRNERKTIYKLSNSRRNHSNITDLELDNENRNSSLSRRNATRRSNSRQSTVTMYSQNSMSLDEDGSNNYSEHKIQNDNSSSFNLKRSGPVVDKNCKPLQK